MISYVAVFASWHRTHFPAVPLLIVWTCSPVHEWKCCSSQSFHVVASTVWNNLQKHLHTSYISDVQFICELQTFFTFFQANLLEVLWERLLKRCFINWLSRSLVIKDKKQVNYCVCASRWSRTRKLRDLVWGKQIRYAMYCSCFRSLFIPQLTVFQSSLSILLSVNVSFLSLWLWVNNPYCISAVLSLQVTVSCVFHWSAAASLILVFLHFMVQHSEAHCLANYSFHPMSKNWLPYFSSVWSLIQLPGFGCSWQCTRSTFIMLHKVDLCILTFIFNWLIGRPELEWKWNKIEGRLLHHMSYQNHTCRDTNMLVVSSCCQQQMLEIICLLFCFVCWQFVNSWCR